MKPRDCAVDRADLQQGRFQVKGQPIGEEGKPFIIAGPCTIESRDQMLIAARELSRSGIKLLRGGAYKLRTSPYSFRGLGAEGLKILRSVADEFGMATVSEIVSVHDLDLFDRYVDIVQIGTRNMHNYDLLEAAAELKKPMILKRGFSATIREFVLAAEYILSKGNDQIILCERGIRTFETSTRFTLDISAVPILKLKTPFPVMVDISHSTGRKDIMIPIARASLAAGADGLMVEVHPSPQNALCDAQQQLDLTEFKRFVREVPLYLTT